MREGKAFDGWYYDGSKWDFDTPIVSDIMLVAHWNNEYVVTFDVQGHGTAPGKKTCTEGGKVDRPPDPTCEGYLFGGWYRESGCTNEWDFSSDTVTSDITLYAKWTAIRKVTVLVNDADWGSISITPEVTGDIIVDYGTSISVLGNKLILGGYTVVAT